MYKGHQKLDGIEQAERGVVVTVVRSCGNSPGQYCTGAVLPEDLIRYAHHISQASSVVSPIGWQLSEGGMGKALSE